MMAEIFVYCLLPYSQHPVCYLLDKLSTFYVSGTVLCVYMQNIIYFLHLGGVLLFWFSDSKTGFSF